MKDKIKDESRKKIVEAYQKSVQEAIIEIKSNDLKLSSKRKDYIQTLEENIKRAPYVLGYLEWPEEKKKKKLPGS
jgi:hypothetical protein